MYIHLCNIRTSYLHMQAPAGKVINNKVKIDIPSGTTLQNDAINASADNEKECSLKTATTDSAMETASMTVKMVIRMLTITHIGTASDILDLQ